MKPAEPQLDREGVPRSTGVAPVQPEAHLKAGKTSVTVSEMSNGAVELNVNVTEEGASVTGFPNASTLLEITGSAIADEAVTVVGAMLSADAIVEDTLRVARFAA